jgi:NAD(P)-dependent dehydrogenase (short-subunit alcohol dehydrogenase family)
VNIDLTEKTALVTGSTQGIGYAIANGLANSGARVAVNGRSADPVADAVERLRAAGGEVFGIAADVTTEAGVADVVRDAKR